MLWPGDAGRDVARVYRDLASDAPDELGSGLVFLTGPPEEFVPAHLQGNDDRSAIARALGRRRRRGRRTRSSRSATCGPEVDLVGPMPYADFQRMIDDPPGMRNYWSADYHDEFPDDALDVFVKSAFDRPSPLTSRSAPPWGGAVGRLADDADAARRTAPSVDLASVRGLGGPGRRPTRTSTGRGRSGATSPGTPTAAST